MQDSPNADFSSSKNSVSVIIPAHNAALTIQRAIKSVADQQWKDLEVVVLDDASVDGTLDRIGEYPGLNLIKIRAAENLGAPEARNRAIEASSGRYISFLDADDAWLPSKLVSQIAELKANPNASFVYCEAKEFGPGQQEIGLTNHRAARPYGRDAWKVLLRESCVTTSCVTARRQSVLDTGGFRKELLSGQDQDMWIRLSLQGDVIYQPETLVHYFILGQSLSQDRHRFAVDDLLPVVRRHIDENRNRLTETEISNILSARLVNKAKAIYRSGELTNGISLMQEASRLGASKGMLGSFAIKNSPPALWLKQVRQAPSIQKLEQELQSPELLVVVDTEEEFDWSSDFDRKNRSVRGIDQQHRAQEIFAKHGLVPTYVVDYPVVENENSARVLRDYQDRGDCTIGSHLHPWVNPPYDEDVNNYHSYPGNLPFELEFEKLSRLTDKIDEVFNRRPNIYKAGRYGMGKSTTTILRTLGYQIDMSVVPYTDFSSKEGPNFTKLPSQPFWMGDEFDLLEIPLTRDFCGLLKGIGPIAFPTIVSNRTAERFIAGPLSRLGLLERVTLTPEGIQLSDMKKLAQSMSGSNSQILCLTYHSSSLLPGGSPYVNNEEDVSQFLQKLDSFLTFFFGSMGGRATTPSEVLKSARHATNKTIAQSD